MSETERRGLTGDAAVIAIMHAFGLLLAKLDDVQWEALKADEEWRRKGF